LWGVNPVFIIEYGTNSYGLLRDFIKKAREIGLLDEESVFILTMGCEMGKEESINLVRILDKKIVKKVENEE